MKDIHDLITHAKYGDDRLRGSGVVAGQISAFPIDFAGRPYNTLALPCECVIQSKHLIGLHRNRRNDEIYQAMRMGGQNVWKTPPQQSVTSTKQKRQ